MSVITSSTESQVRRLLSSYPARSVKDRWPNTKHTKVADVIDEVVGSQSDNAIEGFAQQHFSCCKQDIYVYEHSLNSPLNIPQGLPGETLSSMNGDPGWPHTKHRALKKKYNVVLRDLSTGDPFDEEISFIWPIQYYFTATHLLVKLVKMRPSVKTYFPQHGYVKSESDQSTDTVLEDIETAFLNVGGISKIDLHKGVKHLWKGGFCDSRALKYKRAKSTRTEEMNKDLLIRKHQPNLFQQILQQVIIEIAFIVVDAEHGLLGARFQVEPRDGHIDFPTYSNNPGDTHDVVEKIISNC